MGSISDSPLGKATRAPEAYDPALLYPVERAPLRAALGIGDALPFAGCDRWTAWEATWLDGRGRPRVAVATFEVPCRSPRLVESKSVKLWLASLRHATFATAEAFRAALARDLSAATGAAVDVRLALPEDWARTLARRDPDGAPLDDEIADALPDAPDATLIVCGDDEVAETLLLRAFRSVCPVTGQPDHADVAIGYRGRRIVRASLYAYLVGYRRHPGFHEHCVERIFADVLSQCAPAELRVEARFARRGGVDINPVRWRGTPPPPSPPTLRQ